MRPTYHIKYSPLGAYQLFKNDDIQLSFGVYDPLEEVVEAFAKYLNKEVIP